MPDRSVMTAGPVHVEVEQKNCEELELRAGKEWTHFLGVRDDEGRFVVDQGDARASLPPPIVLFSGGANTWTLERDGSDLIYTRRYHERGLFMLFMPYSAHREVTCRLKNSPGA
ncbi:MAG TPA: hypothetical protein VMU84_10025, partial [Thermoanaerobaculia bacterium]|nr:hypothetical protein [Thermoanaerobaculia bacterium]